MGMLLYILLNNALIKCKCCFESSESYKDNVYAERVGWMVKKL